MSQVPTSINSLPEQAILADRMRRFGGIARLYGDAGLQRLQASHVCVIGVGGVGSWVAEALARSGVGSLSLIDMDHVAVSNINRQIHADDSTLGMAKIEAMRRRLALINPQLAVQVVDDFVTVENAAMLLDGGYDFVIDCADNARVKAEIVARCRRSRRRVITVGGAGGRIDPSRIRIADLSRTEHDPLLARVRRILRTSYGLSSNPSRRFDVPCVYSSEQVTYATESGETSREESAARSSAGLSCAGGLGSVTHVTASFAFHAAGYVLERIADGRASRDKT